MQDHDVLRIAADVLQRKVSVIVRDGMGKPITEPIAHAMLTAGVMAQTVEFLREVADAFEESSASN